MWILARSNRTCGSVDLVLLFGAWNGRQGGEVGVVSTLLGPEGTHLVCCFRTTGSAPSPNQSPRVGDQVALWWAGFWLFFENYTVDASIFVVKL